MGCGEMDRGAYEKHLDMHAREAEQCLIAALFGKDGPEVFNQLSLTGLTPDDFFAPAFRLAYGAAVELAGRGEYPDRNVLAGYIKSNPAFTQTIQSEVIQAVASAYSLGNINAYADTVIEKARARKIAGGLSHLMARAGEVGGDLRSDDLLREIDAVSMSIGERNTENGLLRDTSNHLNALIEVLDARQNGQAMGVRTGIHELDQMLGGLQGGELIIVAGRPAMGKSVFGFGVGSNHAIKAVPGIGFDTNTVTPDLADVPLVAGFSMEMPESQLTMRLLADFANIKFRHLRDATLTDDDWIRLTQACPLYGRADLRIDAAGTLTPAILRAKVRALERQTGKKVSLIVIDYLQLMSGDERHQNRASEIAEITRKLKLLAKELNVPVVALSQLNRDLEKRTDKRPLMADLRESGSIEQDADVILFLYRDEYYNPDSQAKGLAEIIIGKGRNVSTGTVIAQFSGEYQRFSNRPTGYTYESAYGA
jgi:replicative DNA helicase